MSVAIRTVIDVLRLSTEYLAQHGSTSPRLDAELLMAHALRVRRLDIYLQHDRPLHEGELTAARALVRRRGQGEPVAYIVGEREFYNRAFALTPSVLIPRPETETLVELTLRRLREHGDDVVRIADLGTGSGCIAVTLAAEVTTVQACATDISDDALAVALLNAHRHGVQNRITFFHGSWADMLTEPVDVVVSNPPYITTDELESTDRDVREFEPRDALDGGADGLDAYRKLLRSLPGVVGAGALLLFEVDPRRASAVAGLIAERFAGARTSVHCDLGGQDRVVEAHIV
ncbi:MAG: peptide chain release factor N(5)-glutamine methyltransferase [Candidatus Dormibacteria bacterium]